MHFVYFSLKVKEINSYDPEEHTGIKTNPFDENGMILGWTNSQVAPFVTELTLIEKPLMSGPEVKPETPVRLESKVKEKSKRPRRPKRRKPRRKIISIFD